MDICAFLITKTIYSCLCFSSWGMKDDWMNIPLILFGSACESNDYKYLKLHGCNLGSFGQVITKCRQFAICNLQFCKVPAQPPYIKLGE